MPSSHVCSLKELRDSLDVSQSELAAMLGVSVRAVQSYEQGWRPCPPHVQKLAGLMLQLKRQGGSPKEEPCWKVCKCEQKDMEKCITYKFQAPHLCWMITGNLIHGKVQKSWQAKLAKCRSCKVMQRWMNLGDET